MVRFISIKQTKIRIRVIKSALYAGFRSSNIIKEILPQVYRIHMEKSRVTTRKTRSTDGGYLCTNPIHAEIQSYYSYTSRNAL